MHINKNKKSDVRKCFTKKEDLIDEIDELKEKISKHLKEEIKSLEEKRNELIHIEEACQQDGVYYMKNLRFFTVYSRIYDELIYQGYKKGLHSINLEVFILKEGLDCTNMKNKSSDMLLFLEDESFYQVLHDRAIESIKKKDLYLCQVCQSITYDDSFDIILLVDV